MAPIEYRNHSLWLN